MEQGLYELKRGGGGDVEALMTGVAVAINAKIIEDLQRTFYKKKTFYKKVSSELDTVIDMGSKKTVKLS